MAVTKKRSGAKLKRRSRRLRILVLTHTEFLPPDDVSSLSKDEQFRMRTEIDVIRALRELGHHVFPFGIHDDFAPLKQALSHHNVELVFNLLEEFRDEAALDYNIVAYLEAIGMPYTGCNPRGLIVGRDKALSKKVVTYHRVHAPRFAVYRKGRPVTRPSRLEFPLIVKSLSADSSTGIAEASIVRSDEKLRERVEFVHRTVGTHAIVEQYIDGRELYVTVLGHTRLTTLPPWEFLFDDLRADAPHIATSRVKWDQRYQDRHNLYIQEANLTPALERALASASRRIYRALNFSGYARIDYRLQHDGKLYFLEANPNPDIQENSEAVGAAESAGFTYPGFISRLVALGLRSLD